MYVTSYFSLTALNILSLAFVILVMCLDVDLFGIILLGVLVKSSLGKLIFLIKLKFF